MVKKFTLCLVIMLMLLNSSFAFAAGGLEVTAEGAILVDLNTGQVLYSKNPNEKYAPASTTKVLTALIALEKCNLSDKVVVGSKPPFEDGSKIYLIEGEELTVEQLLNALLIESANDSALALAEHIGGSKEGFAKLMNEKAKEIGCLNSNFTNPNGLFEDNHYTTAYDLALISRKAMENDQFRKIVSTLSYQIQPTNKQPEIRYLHNHNKLLTSLKSKYPGVDGVKTGYTVKAKHTFVGSLTRGNRRLLAVVLKDERPVYEDIMNLFDYGLNNFNYEKIASKDEIVENLKVGESNDFIPLYLKEDLYLCFPKDRKIDVNKKLLLNSNNLQIKKGDSLGFMEVSTGDSYKFQVPVISGKDYSSMLYDVKADKSGKLVTSLGYKRIALPSAGILFILLSTSLYIKKKNRKRRLFK